MKRILITIFMVLMLFSIVSVTATDTKELNFTSDKYEIERGQSIVLTISSEELTAIEGTLKFDKNIYMRVGWSAQLG